MKVCSECQFIYEDDQNLCDMDGAELLYDPAPLALSQVAAAGSTVPLAKSRRRRLAATAATGVVLGTVFVLLLQVLMPATQEQLSATSPQSPTYSSADGDSAATSPNLDIGQPVPLAPAVDVLPAPPEQAVDELPAPTPQASPHSPSPKSTDLPERAPKATADAVPAVRPSAKETSNDSARVTSATSPQRQPATRVAQGTRKPEQAKARSSAANRDGSKIGSLLKKTGRILKKPFGF